MRSPKHNVSWINQKIRRMCRKKQRLFNKAKRSSKSRDWSAYKSLKKDTSKDLRRAHWQYVNNILLGGLQSKDSKPFWVSNQLKHNFELCNIILFGMKSCNTLKQNMIMINKIRKPYTFVCGQCEISPSISNIKFPQKSYSTSNTSLP